MQHIGNKKSLQDTEKTESTTNKLINVKQLYYVNFDF